MEKSRIKKDVKNNRKFQIPGVCFNRIFAIFPHQLLSAALPCISKYIAGLYKKTPLNSPLGKITSFTMQF